MARVIVLLVVAALALAGAVETTRAAVRPGIWTSAQELEDIPRRGSSWKALKRSAQGDFGRADIANRNSEHDLHTLAAALVWAREGKRTYRRKAVEGILEAIGTERGGSTLSLARNLLGYVIAADLVDLRAYDPAGDRRFRHWLRTVRTARLGDSGRNDTLVHTHERTANNWGTHAGASRIAVAAYLGDRKDVRRAARVFKGWLGDRGVYAGFQYTSNRSWQADPDRPVGVNPAGATKEGHDIGGALPEEMRRGGKFRWPPKETGYPWEALQGAVVQAELLARRGYGAWHWGDQALRRATGFLYALSLEHPEDDWWAHGDDTWIPWLVNARYGTDYPTRRPSEFGKNMGFTDWTHGRAARRSPSSWPPHGVLAAR